MKSIPLVVLMLVLAGCSSGTKDSPSPPPAAVSQQPAPVPSDTGPVTRPGKVGQPFDVPGWRITVTSVKCGPARELMKNGDDTGHSPNVCIAALTVVNTAATAHGFDDPTSPDFAAFDAAGNRYEGSRWLHGPVNPGVTDQNEYVFDVAAGTRIVAVLVGDVRVSA